MASGSGSGGDGSRNVNRGKGHVENLLQNIGDAVIADDVTFQQFIEDRFGSNQPSTPNPEFDGLNPAYNTPNINENVSNPLPPSDDFFAVWGFDNRHASVKAIKSTTKVDDEERLAYWILYSFLTLTEMVLQPILEWIPIWYTAKLVLMA
ncbi:hypothetical protein EZV62_019489 [Acer yangbiense]|uniref:HVA22-like protein n=1 Tax=Acer yangbiense TaxID=1000413 RepID=A0A5C7HAG1_9ROSI|nr:hypothetical protein EZV62_019489 [Acer yangbiense]